MQVGNFRLHARKFRLAGLFVNRNNIHKKQRFVVKRAVFLVPKATKQQSNKATLEKSRDKSHGEAGHGGGKQSLSLI